LGNSLPQAGREVARNDVSYATLLQITGRQRHVGTAIAADLAIESP
jgi:hypothetical protein